MPHVAEGIDPEARNEFLCLSDDTLPGGHDAVDDAALIHAIALLPDDADLLATRLGSVVWSPRSNISLYGMTAPITTFRDLGLNVALGSDWLPSGWMNILRELQCARDYSDTILSSGLSVHELRNQQNQSLRLHHLRKLPWLHRLSCTRGGIQDRLPV